MDKSIFINLLGTSAKTKILDFLIDNIISDYTKGDIAKETGISRATLNSFWKQLSELGIIKETRRLGRATLYTLNRETEIVKKMIEFDFALSKDYANKSADAQNSITAGKKALAYA